jgi:hypothetical protein
MDVPNGFKVVNYRLPVPGEWYIQHNNCKAIQVGGGKSVPSGPRFILKRISVLRSVRVTDCKPGEKVVVKDNRGDVYYLLGWMDQSAVIHNPAGPGKYNTFTYNPDCLFIEE